MYFYDRSSVFLPLGGFVSIRKNSGIQKAVEDFISQNGSFVTSANYSEELGVLLISVLHEHDQSRVPPRINGVPTKVNVSGRIYANGYPHASEVKKHGHK